MYARQRRIGYGFFAAGLGLVALFLSTQAQAGTCVTAFSPQARQNGTYHLCTVVIEGRSEVFSCLKYTDDMHIYTVLYKGGPTPKGILRGDREEPGVPELIWKTGDSRPGTCRVPVPEPVPASAAYLGTGVCLDERERPLPCSAYTSAEAREYYTYRYLVFYDPGGRGPVQVEQARVSVNHDAFVAEMAYLIGMGLQDSECCWRQAEAYLTHAYKLFPELDLYSDTFFEFEPLNEQALTAADTVTADSGLY